jgi:hypothetical protein
VRLRADWDLDPAWQIGARVTHTDKGENDLDEPFLPGSPRVDSFDLEGVVQRSRELELSLRWWPASGVNLAVSGGYEWVDNQDHIAGKRDRNPSGSIEVHLMR